MADLPNRQKLEAEVRRIIKRAFKPYRKADHNRQPSWAKIRKQLVSELHPVLERIRLEAARNFNIMHGAEALPIGWQPPESRRAEELVEDLIEHSRSEWRAIKRPLKRDAVLKWRKRHLGDQRAETIAITEVTMAQSAGEDAAWKLAQQQGIALEGIWKTYPDACEICEPLHDKPSKVWRLVAPGGPPRHVRCRCHIEHKPLIDAQIKKKKRKL